MPGSVNLSGKAGCTVRYWIKIDTELNFDYFVAEASGDGTSWTELVRYHGTSVNYPDSWYLTENGHANFAGDSSVFLRFRLVSDSSIVRAGAHIDDVEVCCVGSTYTADSYRSIQGTSMATPMWLGWRRCRGRRTRRCRWRR